MSEDMKSSEDTDSELAFPIIDPSLIDQHREKQNEFVKKIGPLSGIHDTRSNMMAILDNPLTRELRLISERCISGEELLTTLETSGLTYEIISKHSRNWVSIRYNVGNKKEMLSYINSCIVQNISDAKKQGHYQQVGFQKSYFQILICIQDFYKKLPG